MAEELLLDEAAQDAVMRQLASDVASQFANEKEHVALMGIQRRGVSMANRLKPMLDEQWGIDVPNGILDINLYRDDLTTVGAQPKLQGTEVGYDVEDKIIILTDDVLFTGRTVRSALNAIVDLGRPKRVALMVLVDRGWRELPVQADFVGKTLETTLNQIVHVHFKEHDGDNAVWLHTKDAADG